MIHALSLDNASIIWEASPLVPTVVTPPIESIPIGNITDWPRTTAASISVEECLDIIGSPPADAIAIFVNRQEDDAILEEYIAHLLTTEPRLSHSSIITWSSTFGNQWLTNQISHLSPAESWKPLARSYYALAATASGAVHLLNPAGVPESNPYGDGRPTPWNVYIYPTLMRKDPRTSPITVIDTHDFSRTRPISGRRGRLRLPPRPAYLGESTLIANSSKSSYLRELIVRGEPVPSANWPTVFWSSLCADGNACLDSSEALVSRFIEERLEGKGVHWFNLEAYWGTDPATIEPPLVADYLAIARDSVCYDEPGLTAVLEAEIAQGVVYIILPAGKSLKEPNQGVKKDCWWCDCELPVLTRNLKVAEIVRVDSVDWGKTETVWRRGDVPIGRSPYVY